MTKEENTSNISIDMLCKACVLILLGIEITEGNLVHFL